MSAYSFDWEARDAYLAQFPQPRRSLVMSVWRTAARPDRQPIVCDDATKMPRLVGAVLQGRIDKDRANAARWGAGPDATRRNEEFAALVRPTLRGDLALRFGAHVIAELQAGSDATEKAKSARSGGGDQYRRAAAEKTMAAQRPSDAQVGFLRQLGYSGPLRNKLHASQIIEAIQNGGTPVEPPV